MRATRTVLVVAASLAACSGGETGTGPQGTVSIALNVTSGSVAQGRDTTVTVTLTRGGGYSGSVSLAAEGLPAGVTATFTPGALTGTTNTSTMSLSVGATATLGTTTFTIRASGSGVTAATRGFALTVLPPPITIVPGTTTATLAQAGVATVTLAILRPTLPGPVAMTAEGLPSGVTAAFAPSTVNDSTALLTLTASAGATLGAANVLIRGTGPASNTATASLLLTVLPAGGGGTVSWRFCDPLALPGWFAFRSGTGGTWNRVTAGANATYNFTLAAGVGAVAFVSTAPGYPYATVHYGTATDLAVAGANDCSATPVRKTLTASVAGLASGERARIILGESNATVAFPGTTLDLSAVRDGPVDLIANRGVGDAGDPAVVPDRFILRRSVNYPASSAIPLLDFGSAEAFAPTTATLTFANADGGTIAVSTEFATARGLVGALEYEPSMYTTATTYLRRGIPAARLQPGEYHVISARRFSVVADDWRMVTQYHREFQDRTVGFGPVLAQPAISTLGTAPYARLRADGTWQDEYSELDLEYTQAGASPRSWNLIGTRDYFGAGASSYAFDVPDLSGVAGFNAAWGLAVGTTTDVRTIGRSAWPTVFAEGAVFRTAQRAPLVVTP